MMKPDLIGFWLIAAVSVGTALGVILHRNPVRSALLLVVNFMCLALLYVLLNAQVLALLQILVYAGAIMVLFLFVIMLLNLGGERATTDPLVGQKFLGALLGALLLAGLIFGLGYAKDHGPVATPEMQRLTDPAVRDLPQIQIIGWDLFTRYVYPFELTSILLLVGAIGVIILTKRDSTAATTSNNAQP